MEVMAALFLHGPFLINVLFHFQSFDDVTFIPYINGTTLALKIVSLSCPLFWWQYVECGVWGEYAESSHSRNAVITSRGAQERT